MLKSKLLTKKVVLSFEKFALIILVVIIMSSNTFAYFPNQTQLTSQNTEVISGNAQDLQKTIETISKYTPLIKTSSNVIISEQSADNFIQKPEILTTKTRAQIDSDLKAEKQKKLAASRAVVTRNASTTSTNTVSTEQTAKVTTPRAGNGYWYGFCTWYVANKRTDIPNHWGNAKAWLNSAQKNGWATGQTPKVGAIMVTRESWAGHVAFVESVDGNQFTISEMNYSGWARTSTRTVEMNYFAIIGFIY